jgi:hypothetical protein
MTNKSPFFIITASLLAAALTVALPDLELEAAAGEPVKSATIHGMAGAPHAPSAPGLKP